MYWAMGVEPTKLSAATSGCSSKPSTTTLSPCTTLNTPSGRPACLNRSAISSETLGSRSLGFRIKVLPAAMATGNIQQGTMQGKLNRSEEHTSELQSLMRISYAVFCLTKNKKPLPQTQLIYILIPTKKQH